MTSRIPCDAHDYFEIVCMRRSQILVTTSNNEKYQGMALDINIIENKEVLLIRGSNIVHHVLLTKINKLQAMNNNIAQHNFSVKWLSS
jgi:Rho-binding antiterminator